MAVSKRQLYHFFNDYTNIVARDWQIWRLIGRIKSILKEPIDEIKELKLKEMRSLMIINWEHEIETCEKIERSIDELIAISPLSSEEKAFASNTIKAIETCLQRKSKITL